MKASLLFLLVAIISFTAICLAYYMCQLVLIDAKSRNIPKPKFWAFLASSSQNGAGITMYLFKRKNTLSFLNTDDQEKIIKIKRKIYALLSFDLTIFILAIFIL
ncbi:hypothetical protein [Vagococcus carniphilus]|uniref:hypothetical protein n=1 Tax=Vagococcus carniphilus TaxID=218144 RepID=UPI003B5C8F3A